MTDILPRDRVVIKCVVNNSTRVYHKVNNIITLIILLTTCLLQNNNTTHQCQLTGYI